MKFFIDGQRVTESFARDWFIHSQIQQGATFQDARANWEACLRSEDACDCYLPSDIEIVPV